MQVFFQFGSQLANISLNIQFHCYVYFTQIWDLVGNSTVNLFFFLPECGMFPRELRFCNNIFNLDFQNLLEVLAGFIGQTRAPLNNKLIQQNSVHFSEITCLLAMTWIYIFEP